jgi:hypothetical protein
MKKEHRGLNLIVSGLLTLIVIVAVSVMGDYYFDLNDDVLMKDILSGAYTGTPAGHNIQMLYPISAFIALFYRVYRGADWYGIFLCVCQFACIFIISHRIISFFEQKSFKFIAALLMGAFALGAVGAHFLFVQYTFTCGLMSATAAFLILTHEESTKWDHVLSVVLIIVAYLIRSEMLLLTLPIVGVAIFIRWLLDRTELKEYYSDGIQISRFGEKKALFKKYVILCAAIGLGIVLSQVVHKVAYSAPEWKQFNALFDARTELYDFQYIPEYDENKEFYDSIGLSKPEQELLVNYNFGLDEEINTDTLWAVADYASKLKTDETPLLKQLGTGLLYYLYRLKHVAYQKSYEYPMTDAPYNLLVLSLYLITAVIYCFLSDKDKKLPGILSLVLLFACRTSLWMFIIVRGRDPIRITHPLFFMEMAVLLGMIFMASKDNVRYIIVSLAVIGIISAAFVPNQYGVITDEMAERAKMRAHYDALYKYFDEHEDSFYFVDVYTSVLATEGEEKTFSEKMFHNVDNSLANHDLMGGWASKSPLYQEKIEKFGFENMQDALLLDNVYVVSKKTSDTDWIMQYYQDKGINTTLTETDRVADVFVIYKLSKAN